MGALLAESGTAALQRPTATSRRWCLNLNPAVG
jgi:hypothetical protein